LADSIYRIFKFILANLPVEESEMNENRLSQLSRFVFPCMLVIALVSLTGCGAWVASTNPPAAPLEIDRVWTTVGSAGTADETNASGLILDRSTVQFGQVQGDTNPVALPSRTESAMIRYNVTPVDGLFDPRTPCGTATGNSCPGVQMELRYLASGPNAKVVARLVEVDLATGAESDRLKFDSSAFSEDNHYQVQQVGQCTPPALWHFDFEKKAYYIEATLTHSSLVGVSGAGIQMIKLAYITCLG
jgi:hypothetical protein